MGFYDYELNKIDDDIKYISLEYINNHKDEINWSALSKNFNILEFTDLFLPNIHWNEISSTQKMDDQYLKKYKYFLNFSKIPANRFSNELLYDLINHVDWYNISRDYSAIDIDFCAQFDEYLNWDVLSKRITFDELYIIEFDSFLNHGEIDYSLCSADFTLEFEDDWRPQNYARFNEEFIEKYIKKFYIKGTNSLRINQQLSVEFFERNFWKLDPSFIIKHRELPIEFIQKYLEHFDWYDLARNQTLPLDFLIKNMEVVNWSAVCKYQKLPEYFMRECQDRINFYSISKNQALSEDYIRDYQEKLNWPRISIYQNHLSEDFIREMRNRIFFPYLSGTYSEKFIREFANALDLKKIIRAAKSLSMEFVLDFKEFIKLPAILNKINDINEEFIINFVDKDSLRNLDLKNICLSNDFLQENFDFLNKADLCRYFKLDEDFIRNNHKNLNWLNISKYQDLSPSFKNEFKDYINFADLYNPMNIAVNSLVTRYEKEEKNLYKEIKSGKYQPDECNSMKKIIIN